METRNYPGAEPLSRNIIKRKRVYWLSARDRLKPLYVLGFLLGVAVVWLILYFYNGKDMIEQEAVFLTALFLHTAMKMWLASEAGRRFRRTEEAGLWN